MTGNGDFQTSVGDYGDSFLEITPDNSTQPTNKNGHGLSITDYFTPFNEQSLANADTDLGSGGTMFLPDQPGPHPHLLIGSGKQGVIYVIDRDNMGQFNASTDNVVQKVNLSHGTWSSPAYFNNMIYEHASGDVLKAFGLANGVLSAAPIAPGCRELSLPRRDAQHLVQRQRERHRLGRAIRCDPRRAARLQRDTQWHRSNPAV